MKDFILLMHNTAATQGGDWDGYLKRLRERGIFDGGSSIGEGKCFRKDGVVPPITKHIVGYFRVRAESLEAAKEFLQGNPVYEAGGTVEIRELPKN